MTSAVATRRWPRSPLDRRNVEAWLAAWSGLERALMEAAGARDDRLHLRHRRSRQGGGPPALRQRDPAPARGAGRAAGRPAAGAGVRPAGRWSRWCSGSGPTARSSARPTSRSSCESEELDTRYQKVTGGLTVDLGRRREDDPRAPALSCRAPTGPPGSAPSAPPRRPTWRSKDELAAIFDRLLRAPAARSPATPDSPTSRPTPSGPSAGSTTPRPTAPASTRRWSGRWCPAVERRHHRRRERTAARSAAPLGPRRRSAGPARRWRPSPMSRN